MPQAGTDSEPLGDDPDVLRRRIRELELENALMREVVEVAEKDPGADLRRLSNREKTMPVDRLRPRYSLRSLTCLPRYRAQQLPLPPREARRRQVRRAARLRGAGVRRFQGPVRVPPHQGRARDGCLGEVDPQDPALGRVGRPCSRTAALQLVRGRGHASAGQPRQPGFHRRTTQREVAHGHRAGSRPVTERCTFRR